MAFFCDVTGVRIAAAGVSKSVDPVNGQDEVIELPDGSLKKVGHEPAATNKQPAKPVK